MRGRDSDNGRIQKVLGWSPGISLREGMAKTYAWIWQELDAQGRAKAPEPVAPGVEATPTSSA